MDVKTCDTDSSQEKVCELTHSNMDGHHGNLPEQLDFKKCHSGNTGEKHCAFDVREENFSQKEHFHTYIVHTPAGKKSYVCGICQKGFSEKGNLKKHLLTHTGEKPHVCDICQKAFSLKQNLNNHRLTHTGEKPHVCEVCQKGFSEKGNLKKHLLTHTGEKPHVCDICQKAFSLKQNLNKHLLTHKGEKPHM